MFVLLRRISFRDAASQQRASKLDHESGRAKKTDRFLDEYQTFYASPQAGLALELLEVVLVFR